MARRASALHVWWALVLAPLPFDFIALPELVSINDPPLAPHGPQVSLTLPWDGPGPSCKTLTVAFPTRASS